MGITELFDLQPFDTATFVPMLMRFAFSTLSVGLLVRCLYYPKSRRRDYYFTFMLISVSVFLLIYLLGGVKIRVGFALGLFAIFGIIRYRTESMPVREMTYLFVIIAMSVINALANGLSFIDIITVNALFLLTAWAFEKVRMKDAMTEKLVQYDRIGLIKPERREELIADLKERTGLDIQRVDVGGIDFLRDMAVVKIYYQDEPDNTANHQVKMRRDEYSQ